jgi:N-acetylmuramoyl-L-alanine amidase
MTSAVQRPIRRGHRSTEVEDVQARLRALGLVIGDEPGEFSDETVQAVRAFQQERGLLVDGVVGPDTWNELVEATRRLGDRTLYLTRPYMRGDDVLALQERLNALGFDAGRADGIFGPDTDQAVRAFQKEYGVAEDGMFGPRSHASLAGLRVDRPGTSAGLREELRRSERSLTGLRGALVVVDAGHGGDDPGEVGAGGTSEADFCWQLATRVAERLVGAGAAVRFTRTEAENPDATERARRANEMGGDLFVSLHLNAHDGPAAQGASTFYFKTSRAAELLAERVQNELSKLGLKDCRAHGRLYTVLKETRMPAVLIEPAFVTNPEEAHRLTDAEFGRAMADAIVTALHRYYGTRG